MDFITTLPSAHGYSVIMVVIDRLSKFAHFVPLKQDFSSITMAEAFIQNIVKLHGFPKIIVSDRDKVFISRFWQQLFKAQGTKLAMSSAYHPETDGQSEVLNKTLEMYLRCLCYDSSKDWLKKLPWAQYWYNNSLHSAIKMTPYKALYGRDPSSLIKYEFSTDDDVSLQELLTARDRLLQQLKINMQRAQLFMKQYADKKHRHLEFDEGELVLVKLQPYRQHSVALRRNQKLALKFFGPFRITKKISTVAYKLDLPATTKIHNVFHVSVLKKFKGENSNPYLPLPLQTTEEGPILEPHRIVNRRVIFQNGKEVPQMQIEWGTGPAIITSWEPELEVQQNFPKLNLGDKVFTHGGGNVRKHAEAHKNQAEGEYRVQKQGVRKSKRNKAISSWLRDYVG